MPFILGLFRNVERNQTKTYTKPNQYAYMYKIPNAMATWIKYGFQHNATGLCVCVKMNIFREEKKNRLVNILIISFM